MISFCFKLHKKCFKDTNENLLRSLLGLRPLINEIRSDLQNRHETYFAIPKKKWTNHLTRPACDVERRIATYTQYTGILLNEIFYSLTKIKFKFKFKIGSDGIIYEFMGGSMEITETVCTNPGKSCYGIAAWYENFSL